MFAVQKSTMIQKSYSRSHIRYPESKKIKKLYSPSEIQGVTEVIFIVQEFTMIQKKPNPRRSRKPYSPSRNPRRSRNYIHCREIHEYTEVINPQWSKSCHYPEVKRMQVKLPSIHDSHYPFISNVFQSDSSPEAAFCATFKSTFTAQEHRSPVMPVSRRNERSKHGQKTGYSITWPALEHYKCSNWRRTVRGVWVVNCP